MHLGVIPAPALGDGILAMVLAHNAHRAGMRVTIWHDPLVGLRALYPWARIEPLPADDVQAAVAETDALFVGHPDHRACAVDGPTLAFDKSHWLRDRPYLASLRAACGPVFGLEDWDDGPGLVAPEPTARDGRVVALHPTSANPVKNWPPDRWLALAARLEARHWRPTFLVAPADLPAWEDHAGDALPVVAPGPLDPVARWLVDAGGCIATDSGIAHLASALGRPSLAIFRKASAARFWGPAWGRRGATSPRWRLPGGGGHRLWTRLLSPQRVLEHYEALVRRG